MVSTMDPAQAFAPPAAAGTDLVAQLGCEVALLLSQALERVNALARTGRIDRPSLFALRDEIESARRAGMMGQQVGRVASGTVQISAERLDLAALLRDAVQQRSAEITARGIELRQSAVTAAVLGDATLTFSLLQVLLDWSFEHARTRIDLTVELPAWPPHVRLCSSFGWCAPDRTDADAPLLDTISWRLLGQTAAALGLRVARADRAGRTAVTIEFPRTVADQVEGVSAIELDAHSTLGSDSGRALVGSHVLVLAAQREVRGLVRQALRSHGVIIDFVTGIDEVHAYCGGGMPHALVHEAASDGAAFEALRRQLLAAAPQMAFVQINDGAQGFEVRNVAGRQSASVGRGAIVASLASALLFELASSS